MEQGEEAAGCPVPHQDPDRVPDGQVGAAHHVLAPEGTAPFGQLRRDIPTISQKMLAQTLRRLERDGLVSRGPVQDSATGVEYRITPLAEALKCPMSQLAIWAQQNVSAIHAAREAFDKSNRRAPDLQLPADWL